uniref:Peptidase S1 domain-containing protein n=1 Tax=Timema bartmani TaxID=61472 RepID=A0A7R9I609_9NEOP|nr:unnamed protein product [Timema bartmani]
MPHVVKGSRTSSATDNKSVTRLFSALLSHRRLRTTSVGRLYGGRETHVMALSSSLLQVLVPAQRPSLGKSLYKSAICKRPPKIAGGQNACIKEFPSMGKCKTISEKNTLSIPDRDSSQDIPVINRLAACLDYADTKIKGKFKFTDTIKAIPIAPKSKVPGAGAKVTLVGWGRTTFESEL